MKKNYDWDVKLFVQANHSSKKLEIVASIHTNIHKLKIEIAKKLGLSVLDSHIDVYYNGKMMKATSTLLQNQVKNYACLTANIARHKIVNAELMGQEKINKQKEKEKDKQKGDKGGKVRMEGLSIVCSCSNNRCINYNQDVEVEYGFGVFPILNLTSFTKCEFCPYKSQFLRPNMLCKQVKATGCYIKLRGSQADRGGIPVPKDTGFLKIAQEKDLRQFIQERPWHIGMQLTVKHL